MKPRQSISHIPLLEHCCTVVLYKKTLHVRHGETDTRKTVQEEGTKMQPCLIPWRDDMTDA